MSKQYVIPLEHLRMNDVDKVGGKNASLGGLPLLPRLSAIFSRKANWTKKLRMRWNISMSMMSIP